MEEIVDKLAPEVLDTYENICKCPKCVNDIKALTLNKLPPRYVVCEKGLLYTKANEMFIQFKTDIIKELTLSIEVVSKNPNHT